ESAGVDSSIFTKAWVDSAGSEGLKDHSAIDRWQSQAAAADSDFFNRLHVMDEEDTNINLKQSIYRHDGLANESSASQVTMNRELVMKQTTDAEKAMAVFEFLDLKGKNKSKTKIEDLTSKLGTFHSAVVFLEALNQNVVHPLIALENTVFYHERAAGMYLLLPYALAQVIIESISIPV
nr:lysine-specific histone demethylase 1 homolog 3-like [Tanacetum cinerariifolium]